MSSTEKDKSTSSLFERAIEIIEKKLIILINGNENIFRKNLFLNIYFVSNKEQIQYSELNINGSKI